MNAPKDATFLTVPVSSIPTVKSFIVSMLLFKNGAGNSSLGSSPGLSNSFIMSATVYAFTLVSLLTLSTSALVKVLLNSDL